MNKIVLLSLLSGVILSYANYSYNGGTKAAVTMAGSIISAQHTDYIKKYPRKECPICKGTGKYLSGDKISLVDCGYCEPEKTEISKSNKSPYCKCKNCKCNNCGCVPSLEK